MVVVVGYVGVLFIINRSARVSIIEASTLLLFSVLLSSIVLLLVMPSLLRALLFVRAFLCLSNKRRCDAHYQF